MGALYKLTSRSGKSYIGITMRDVELRFTEHVKLASQMMRGPLYAAIRKYGPESFVVDVLASSDDWTELCKLERLAIAEHGTISPNGYNMTMGGDGVAGLAPEARARHRENTSVATKIAWRDGNIRVNRAKTFSKDEFKKKHSAATAAGTRAAYERPSVRENHVRAVRSESFRNRATKQVKALWTDKNYRANQVEKRRQQPRRSEQSRAAQSNLMKSIIAQRKSEGTYWNSKDGH